MGAARRGPGPGRAPGRRARRAGPAADRPRRGARARAERAAAAPADGAAAPGPRPGPLARRPRAAPGRGPRRAAATAPAAPSSTPAWPLVGRDAQLGTPGRPPRRGGRRQSRVRRPHRRPRHRQDPALRGAGRRAPASGASGSSSAGAPRTTERRPCGRGEQVLSTGSGPTSTSAAATTRARSSGPGTASSAGSWRPRPASRWCVVLDDLHWADASSLRVLRLLLDTVERRARCCCWPPGARTRSRPGRWPTSPSRSRAGTPLRLELRGLGVPDVVRILARASPSSSRTGAQAGRAGQPHRRQPVLPGGVRPAGPRPRRPRQPWSTRRTRRRPWATCSTRRLDRLPEESPTAGRAGRRDRPRLRAGGAGRGGRRLRGRRCSTCSTRRSPPDWCGRTASATSSSRTRWSATRRTPRPVRPGGPGCTRAWPRLSTAAVGARDRVGPALARRRPRARRRAPGGRRRARPRRRGPCTPTSRPPSCSRPRWTGMDDDPEASDADRYESLMSLADAHRWRGAWLSLVPTVHRALEVADRIGDVRAAGRGRPRAWPSARCGRPRRTRRRTRRSSPPWRTRCAGCRTRTTRCAAG